MPDLCAQRARDLFKSLGPPMDVTNVQEIGYRKTKNGKTALFYSWQTIKTQEQPNVQAAPTCPKCGETMVRRSGKYGEFFGCSNYPQCRETRRI